MIGKIVSHFKITEEIGRGGMGVVYKAQDLSLDRLVALKFLPAQFSADEEERKRFVHEAKAAATLNHPNIVTVHEIGEHEGQIFIAMEYIEGKSLKELVSDHPAPYALHLMPIPQVLDIASQIASGLSAAHAKGIVHRDLKPANIMLTDEGTAKIVDFGLAKLRGLTRLTKSGTTLGTVAYMSPEQAQGKEVDQRTDIWSLGVILYEMLTGKLPFPGEYEQAMLYAVINEEPKSISKLRSDVPDELQRIVLKALAKSPEKRYQTADELLKELKQFHQSIVAPETVAFSFRRFLLRPKIVASVFLAVAMITSAAAWYLQRQSNIRLARYELLPKIEQLVEAGFEKYTDAYQLAIEAEKYIPADPGLAAILSKIALRLSIRTEPAGAKVFMKGYNTPDGEWQYLGVSPIEKIRLPIGFFRWKMEKEGYETVFAAAATHNLNFSEKWVFVPSDIMRVLDKRGDLPAGMIRVQNMADVPGIGRIGDFFMDRYEVTNRQFKEFVDHSGYQNKEFWQQRFIKEGKELSREEALKGFVDQTGRSGPAAWQAGDYPEGQDDFPVTGISWYEAAAYAESAGKSLPTSHHWGIACGEYTSTPGWWNYISLLAPLSNFKGLGPARVGSFGGMTAFGNFDMAGNIREWCWNETPQGRVVRGGAWDDATYMFAYLNQASPFERSSKTGFRCARYIDIERISGSAFAAVHPEERHDLEKMKPVADAVFQVYKELFFYDKTDLHAHREWQNESSNDWIQEKVTFAAAYGNERVIAYLFLPRNSRPPFQTVVFLPGSATEISSSSDDLEKDFQFDLFLSFIVKNGRAVLYPVLKGSFERGDWGRYQIIDGDISTRQFSEWVIMVVKDIFRCLDYLETRSDIDHQRLAYMGYSAGAWEAPIILALDRRIKASILQNGGFMIYFLGTGPIRPEINQMNYVTRVKTPTLMLNGKYDVFFPYETNARLMFERLGTPRDRKEQKVYNSDHYVPRNELIKETLAWLDKYLGPVKR
jgi:eukaryotic-like serine/threonine-protein kinase